MLLANALLPAIQAVDGNLVIEAVRSMEAVVGRTVTAPRFRTTLLLLFGAVGLLLSAAGVAGVVGFSVARRTPEIGLRMALGAQNREIYATVMGQGARLTLLGLILGMAGVLAGSSVLSSTGLLFAVQPNDPLVLIVAPLCLVIVAAAAIWVPARRAIGAHRSRCRHPVAAVDGRKPAPPAGGGGLGPRTLGYRVRCMAGRRRRVAGARRRRPGGRRQSVGRTGTARGDRTLAGRHPPPLA